MAATPLMNPELDNDRAEDRQRLSNADLAEEAASSRETTISETAKLYNVTLRTLRFYEDRGLIRPRRVGNARFYSGLDRARIQMILNGKRLGFTLTEIAELIGTPDPNRALVSDFEGRLEPHQISTQLDHLERQRREIDEAIARLRATHERLTHSGAA
jgi:DNA-binding transcriptional MerR regulator